MTRLVISLSALLLSMVLLVSGNAFLMTLLGVRLSMDSIDPALIGPILVCYSIGFVVGSLHAHRIIDRVGHIRSFAVFAALTAVITLLHPLAVNAPFWALLRGLYGMALAGILLVVESWFSSRATNENRATLFAVYQIFFYLAAAGGQLLINLGSPSGYLQFSLIAILLTLALIPLSLTRMEAPPIEPTPRLSFAELYQDSSSGLSGALVSGILISAFYNLGPVYANQIGLNLNELSIFMACTIVAAMLFAWPLGRLCDRFDRRRLLRLICLIAACSSLLTAWLGGHGLLPLILFAGIFMGLTASLYPIAVAITNDRMASNRIVAASSSLLLSYGIGSCIGPIAGSLLISQVGPAGLFLGNAAILLILAALVHYWIGHSREVPVAAQEDFVSTMPELTPVMAEIDPRNQDFHPQEELIVDVDTVDVNSPDVSKESSAT